MRALLVTMAQTPRGKEERLELGLGRRSRAECGGMRMRFVGYRGWPYGGRPLSCISGNISGRAKMKTRNSERGERGDDEDGW